MVTTNLKPAMTISTYLSIVTLNVNGLNAPIKRHRVEGGSQDGGVSRAVEISSQKHIESLNGSKSKTHLYAAYKRERHILNPKTYTD